MKLLWKKRRMLLALTLAVFLLAGTGLCASAEEAKVPEKTVQAGGSVQSAETGEKQTEDEEEKKKQEEEEERKRLEEEEKEREKKRLEEEAKEEERRRLEEEGEPLSDYQQMQINLIMSRLDELLQTDEKNTWYYCIMDLDHNGLMEFFAADQHPVDRSTNLKVWEVTPDTSGLRECVVEKGEDESFPDIISNAADTYYDYYVDRWNYLFYDNVVLSPAEVYTVRCSVTMKDGVIGYKAYAVEHSELVDSYRYVSHSDMDGNPISASQYNASGAKEFNEAVRSTTHFDWFTVWSPASKCLRR